MGQPDTQSRILEAAVELFAAKGFHAATIAQICDAAQVNIASVNYHFGSKETLFKRALRHAFYLAEAQYPIRGQGEQADALSPEQQLEVFMDAIIRRSFSSGPASHFGRILTHEATREDGPHALLVEEIQNLQGKVLRAIISKILLTRSERLLNQAHTNIAALCVFPKMVIPLRKKLFPKPPTEKQLVDYIQGQTDCAVACLRALQPRLKQA